MGRKADRPCNQYPCPNYALNGYGKCETHQREHWAKQSSRARDTGKYDTFYKSPAWRKLRAWQLKHEPLCRECKKEAHMVDHIQPITEGGDRLSEVNLQSMCNSCHAKKRAKERHKKRVFGNSEPVL